MKAELISSRECPLFSQKFGVAGPFYAERWAVVWCERVLETNPVHVDEDLSLGALEEAGDRINCLLDELDDTVVQITPELFPCFFDTFGLTTPFSGNFTVFQLAEWCLHIQLGRVSPLGWNPRHGRWGP